MAAEVTHVTVDGPTGRMDISVPPATPLVELIPRIVQFAHRDQTPPEVGGQHWALQRAGEEPLPLAATMAQLDVADGEVLYLRASNDAMSPWVFDDLAEAVSKGSTLVVDVWTAEQTRWWLAVGVLVALATALGILLIGNVPPWVGALVAMMLSGGLATATTVLARRTPWTAFSAGLGILAVASAFVAGSSLAGAFWGDSSALALRGLLGGLLGLFTAVVAVATFATASAWAFAALVTTGVVTMACGLDVLAHTSELERTSVTTTSALALGLSTLCMLLSPRLGMLMAQLKPLPVPRSGDEVRERPSPIDGDESVEQSAKAARFMLGGLLSHATLCAGAAPFLALSREIGGVALLVAFSLIALLRVRVFRGALHRRVLLTIGIMVAMWALVALTLTISPEYRVGAILVPLLVALACALAASRPRGRGAVGSARLASIVDVTSLIAVAPLVLWVCGVFGFMRGRS